MQALVTELGLDVLFKGTNFVRLLNGMWVTLRISLIAVALSIVLGILFGIVMTFKNPIVKAICRVYLEIVRIMPQLVLLFIVYYGSARLVGLKFEPEFAAIIVFTFWGTAEMGDLVRGALQSIPKHQYESAYALGMNRSQTYFSIIIPQTLRRLLPLSINLVTRMIKTTPLIVMIEVVEATKVARQIIDANRVVSPNAAFGLFFVIFVLYFVVCWPISLLASRLEKKWSN